MKALYVSGVDTAPAVIELTRLSPGVVNTLLEEAKSRRLLEVVGLAALDLRVLDDRGRPT